MRGDPTKTVSSQRVGEMQSLETIRWVLIPVQLSSLELSQELQ